jgi:hypothetical protein
MERFKRLGVPADILAIIAKPPLLQGESKDEYFDILAGIIVDLRVADRPEFLWVIRYADCQWEIIRVRRMRALVFDHWRERGRIALVQDRVPGAFEEIDQHLAELYPQGVDPEMVAARGMIMADHHEQLAYFDKLIERLQGRSDSILQLLEARREVFAHRERERFLRAREREQLRLSSQGQAPQLQDAAVEEAA